MRHGGAPADLHGALFVIEVRRESGSHTVNVCAESIQTAGSAGQRQPRARTLMRCATRRIDRCCPSVAAAIIHAVADGDAHHERLGARRDRPRAGVTARPWSQGHVIHARRTSRREDLNDDGFMRRRGERTDGTILKRERVAFDGTRRAETKLRSMLTGGDDARKKKENRDRTHGVTQWL